MSKLDYQRPYDVTFVKQLFELDGEEGRVLYAWDLIVDTFYPLAVARAAILFALTVIRKPTLQKLLIIIPLIFLVTDVIENAFIFLFLGTYPSISPTLVSISSLFTGIKLFMIYPTFYEMFIFMPIAIIVAITPFAKKLWATRKITVQ